MMDTVMHYCSEAARGQSGTTPWLQHIHNCRRLRTTRQVAAANTSMVTSVGNNHTNLVRWIEQDHPDCKMVPLTFLPSHREHVTFYFKKEKLLNGINIVDLVIESKLLSSKSEVRRLIKGKGVKINNDGNVRHIETKKIIKF